MSLTKGVLLVVALSVIITIVYFGVKRCSLYRFCTYDNLDVSFDSGYENIFSYSLQSQGTDGYFSIVVPSSGLVTTRRVYQGKEDKSSFFISEAALTTFALTFPKKHFLDEQDQNLSSSSSATVRIEIKDVSGKVIHSVVQEKERSTNNFSSLIDAFYSLTKNK